MQKHSSDRLSRIAERYPIDETLVLGLDIGIASVGSALLRHGETPEILFAGSRCFDPPENPKTRELENQKRREKRLLRRVIRRRAQRMAKVRSILVRAGVLSSTDPAAFHNRPGAAPPDPWRARAESLDRLLTESEFAAAILHIAKHRGFKSNSKSGQGDNAPDDDKKMLGAVQENRGLLARYVTVGQMVARDPKFAGRKRNKGGEYTHTFARDDLSSELAEIFKAQRRYGNKYATEALQQEVEEAVSFQRPLKDSEEMVGYCPFIDGERRSPKNAPSFEKFRFLAKLNTVKVRGPEGSLRRLTAEELSKAVDGFGQRSKSITWNALAKTLGLGSGVAFDGVDEKRARGDVAAASGSASATKTFFDILGPAGWNSVKDRPEILDEAARVLSFRDDLTRIEEGLAEIPGLEPVLRTQLMEGVRSGAFSRFSGAGHISAKAARAILPHLLERLVYSDACAAAGFDHTASRRAGLEDIRNPVVQRSLREALKQVETLIHRFQARPGRIIVELARDVGKSTRERDEIARGMEKRRRERAAHRETMKTDLNLDKDPSEEELQRYELWKEQNYRCIYTDSVISPPDVLSDKTQVDHVLPRSRSHDNSYANRVLCLTEANQEKKNRTPWEWKGADTAWWDAFEARVGAMNVKPYKKRLLKMTAFDERSSGFVKRNLNDTRYASRALLSGLQALYFQEKPASPAPSTEGETQTRRLFARPGAVTALLRRAWGLDRLKDREDDRHHALDAMICAAARSEWLLNKLTVEYQTLETGGRSRWTPSVPTPWKGFERDALEAFERVFVSRSEKRRGRGGLHKETVYAIGEEDGRKVTYERKAIANLTKADLARIKDAEVGNRPVAEALRAWIEAGKPMKPEEALPRSPKGDPIRKVSLRRTGVSGFTINEGHVDNGDMVRVDVFAKPNKKGGDEFYLVPIYRHQVIDRLKWPSPPNRAIVAHKDEKDWVTIDDRFAFRFSLHSDCYVRAVKRNGEIVEGYYRYTDRSTGGAAISRHNVRGKLVSKVGMKTLSVFQKYEVDRLGQLHEILQETRTWHGVASI